MAARGWAWTAYDWDEGRLFNYLGDAQNTFPVWNATPLVALDVYEHAYFLDYQTDRASYIDAFFGEPRLGRRERLGRPVRNPDEIALVARHRRRLPRGLDPVGVLARPRCSSTRTSASAAAGTSARRTSGGRTARWYGVPVVLLDTAKGFVPALVFSLTVSPLAGVLAGAARDARPRAAALPPLREGRQDGRDDRRRLPRRRAARRCASAPSSGSSSSCCTRYASVASIARRRLAARSRRSCSATRGR